MTKFKNHLDGIAPLGLIDAFSGAGGMTIGFTATGAFQPVWANDFDRDAVATYNHNFGPHGVRGDIESLLADPAVEIPRADVVIGGPPCQGFSLLNKERKTDARRQLWMPFLELTERSGATVFVMENVPQLLGSAEHEQIVETARDLGFKSAWGKLCAADYGVPQTRRRAFIVGCKFADPSRVFPPPPTHYDPKADKNGHRPLFDDAKKHPWRTVRDAVGDLPPPTPGFGVLPPPLDLHFTRTPTETSVRRYETIPPGGNRFDLQRLAPELTPACWIRKKSGGTDLFGRLWWDRPAFTIRTEFFKPEKGRYLHPEQHRPITHREAARLQSFPDDFTFCGNKVQVAKQIGNAVPPRLAQGIARAVLELFAENGEKYKPSPHADSGFDQDNCRTLNPEP